MAYVCSFTPYFIPNCIIQLEKKKEFIEDNSRAL